MITAVSSAEDVMEAKRCDASAAMKLVESLGSLLRVALRVAEWMLLALMSMPREDLKRLESVMVKRPEPE